MKTCPLSMFVAFDDQTDVVSLEHAFASFKNIDEPQHIRISLGDAQVSVDVQPYLNQVSLPDNPLQKVLCFDRSHGFAKVFHVL